MYAAHSTDEPVTAEEQYAPKRQRGTFPRRLPLCYRIFFLLLLVLFGLHLLAAGSDVSSHASLTEHESASNQSGLVSKQSFPLQVGLGAGATSHEMTNVNASVATCLNPLDATCWLQNAAQWMAQQIMGALQPVIGAIMRNPLNILTQTPPVDTYQNPTVISRWQSFLAVVDLALASLIVIGGYNVVVGRHLGLPHSELAEFLPRLLLAFGAAHFSLFFLGLFIDLENALNLVALNLAGTSMLTNIINALFQGSLVTEGLLVWVLTFILGVMAVLLGAQMAIRLALLWVLLVTSLGASNIFGVGGTMTTLLVCVALLYLVLRIPGIVHRFALRPMMDASRAVGGAATGAVGVVAEVAPRLLALL